MKKYLLNTFLFFILSLPAIKAQGFNVVALKSGSIEPYNLALEGFKSESEADVVEYDLPSGAEDKKKILDAVRSKPPELILAIGIEALLLVKNEIYDIPIVYCMVMDPEKYSILHAKNNITGIVLRTSAMDQIVKLKTIMPNLQRLGVMYNPENTGHQIDEAKKTAEALGIDLIAKEIRSEKDVPDTLRRLIGKIDALWLIADSTVVNRDSFKFIILFTLENRCPIAAYSEAFVKAGAIMALSPDYFSIGQQAARLADNIVNKKGKPSTQLIMPDIAKLSVNLKTAGLCGVNIPEDIIDSAEEVFR